MSAGRGKERRNVERAELMGEKKRKEKKDCPALDWIVAHGVEGGTLPKIWYVRSVPRKMVAFDLHGTASPTKARRRTRKLSGTRRARAGKPSRTLQKNASKKTKKKRVT